MRTPTTGRFGRSSCTSTRRPRRGRGHRAAAGLRGLVQPQVSVLFRAATRPQGWRPARARPTPADAVGAVVSGNCQDVAGNVGTGSFALNYDATPPAPRPSMPCRAIARSRWRGRPHPIRPLRSSASHGTGLLSSSIRGPETSSPIARSATAAPLCRHAGRPGRQPGCSSGQHRPDRVAAAAALRGQQIKLTSDDTSLPLLVWKRVGKARYYNVQMFRGGRKVLSAWPKRLREDSSGAGPTAERTTSSPRAATAGTSGPLRQALGASVRETTGCELFSHGR